MNALLGIFNIIPSWVFALITAGALATSCVQTTRVSMEKASHAQSRSAFDAERTKAAQAAQAQSEKYRAIEQELSHAQAETERETASLRGELDRARAAGGVSAVGLRNAVATAATAARADCSASASAELRETAATAARVSADVFDKLEQRARLLGITADERGIAGRGCERIHEEAVKLTSQ